MPDEFDVFLSHNSRDKPAVVEISGHLRARGLRVWLDKDELRPGLPWQEGLEEGVRASHSVAVFVGAEGMGTWQAPEMRAFLARSKKEQLPVIPVLLPGCPDTPQLALFLEAMTWVDLRQGLTPDGLNQLAWGITGTKGEHIDSAAGAISPHPGRAKHPKTARTWWKNRAIALSLLVVLLTLAGWLWLRSPEPPPLRPGIYAVRVQVVDPKGQPVTGSTIRASTGNEPQRTPDGWWEVEIPAAKVPAASRITLWAEHPDWGGNRKDLILGADPNVQVEIRLKAPESWLRGQVIDERGRGLEGVRVSRQDGTLEEALTDSEGRFALTLSVPPETRIRLRADPKAKSLAPADTFCLAGRDTCSILLEKP
jgi:TIR domain